MLTINEILKATAGKLVYGSAKLKVKRISIDSRDIKRGDLFIAIKGERFDGHDFIDETIKKGVKAVVVEKFLPDGRQVKSKVENYKKINVIKVKDTVRALGDIAKYWRSRFNIPLICVTGSNGKTTTKDMIAWVLARKFKVLKNHGTKNNQIGLPLTLLQLNKNYDLAVVEIGTNHFGEIKYLSEIARANIGVITNIGHSHLQAFGGLKGVYKEKSDLLKNLTFPRLSILNADDDFLKSGLQRKGANFNIGFGVEEKSDFFAFDIRKKGQGLSFKVNSGHVFKINTLGRKNIYNALAAIAVSRSLGLGYEEIIERLSKFEFPYSRLQFKKIGGINFIDDTYNSNPLSLEQALEALASIDNAERKIFVMGDMLELGGRAKDFHRRAGEKIKDICDALITVGELSVLAARQAKKCGLGASSVFSCRSSGEARKILESLNPTHKDIVLVKGSRGMLMEGVFKG